MCPVGRLLVLHMFEDEGTSALVYKCMCRVQTLLQLLYTTCVAVSQPYCC